MAVATRLCGTKPPNALVLARIAAVRICGFGIESSDER